MSVLPVHLLGSPVLRQRAAEIGRPDEALRRLVDDLFETMHAHKGAGLAANQVGLARRVAVVAAEGMKIVLIDPVITSRAGEDRDEEGCLSIPDLYGDVTRSAEVEVETTQWDGSRVRVAASGLAARAVQHEIDHLDGVLFIDHLSPLKRAMLLRKWQKQRKGATGYLKEVVPAADT